MWRDSTLKFPYETMGDFKVEMQDTEPIILYNKQ